MEQDNKQEQTINKYIAQVKEQIETYKQEVII